MFCCPVCPEARRCRPNSLKAHQEGPGIVTHSPYMSQEIFWMTAMLRSSPGEGVSGVWFLCTSVKHVGSQQLVCKPCWALCLRTQLLKQSILYPGFHCEKVQWCVNMRRVSYTLMMWIATSTPLQVPDRAAETCSVWRDQLSVLPGGGAGQMESASWSVFCVFYQSHSMWVPPMRSQILQLYNHAYPLEALTYCPHVFPPNISVTNSMLNVFDGVFR